MKKTPFIIALLIWTATAPAQDYIDLATFDYAITPVNTFDTTDATTTLQEINGNLTAPIVINDRFTFLTGIIYENISAAFDPGRKEESVTGLTLKLGANINHNSKWSGTYMLLPKISSDFNKISNRDFQLGGVVLMKYIKTDRLNYKFGVYANSESFGPFIVPLFGFYYLNPTEKIEVKVLLPLSVDLNYSITKNVRLGLNFKGQTRSYHLNSPAETEVDRYLVKFSQDLYTYFQYGTKNGFNFQLGLGRSLGRSYRIYDEKISLGLPLLNFGDNRTQLNTDFSDSWLFKVSVFYRLKLKKLKGSAQINKFIKIGHRPNTY
ncbi:hypothetical protein FORMB_17880 [Formosa sp. Hel1_33_131]|uniref:DUF6268 family outer membrane beta-barrel protein n=1 Tax=Formosa sp. Hel1_33_131 TaxID=1336794 RepID=UPI00084E3263|nr:DUF6268 family outer membrane beta-barrel protein [Formosa sp. Hel1_33_131]AOR28822.1 hypothetical protein FORMB_17880 [Formosa sp. Hel1_33_131]